MPNPTKANDCANPIITAVAAPSAPTTPEMAPLIDATFKFNPPTIVHSPQNVVDTFHI